MTNKKLVLFASYPKTGSTLLPNLIDRWGRTVGGNVVLRFVWGGGKNNFLLLNKTDTPRQLIKTHYNIEDFTKRLKKHPAELSWALESINKGEMDLPTGKGYGLIYTLRNPFCVLVSGINYSRLLFARDEVREKWKNNGLDRKYFVDFLGMNKVPEVDEFAKYSLLDSPGDMLDKIAGKFVKSMGSIPIFDTDDGKLGYFGHILYYKKLMSKMDSVANVSYEGLMSRDVRMLGDIARVLNIESEQFVSAWDAENVDRQNSGGRYGNTFYSGFRTATPQQFTQLSSWPRLLAETKEACPPLAETFN